MAKPKWRETGLWQPEETLITEEQIAKCVRAYDLDDGLGSPVPTRNVSNGEYLPVPQSGLQQQVEQRIRDFVARSTKKLGIGRQKFQATDGGIAAGLLAMNETHGRFFDIAPGAMLDADEFRATSIPPDVFVMDGQLHFVRGKSPGSLHGRATAQGPTAAASGVASNPFNPKGQPDEFGDPWPVWNPALEGLQIVPENFHLVQFIKDVYLDSQVTVGLISNITGYVDREGLGISTGFFSVSTVPVTSVEAARERETLTAGQTAAARDFINETAGSRRCLAHGMLYPGVGNLDYIQYQIEEHRPDSWKGYCLTSAAKVDNDPRSLLQRWRLDDEAVAYPTYELIAKAHARLGKQSPGLNNICVHKGLTTREAPDLPEVGHPSYIPKACRDWPQLNFIIYHSCMKTYNWDYDGYQDVLRAERGDRTALRQGVPDIPWVTEFAQTTAGLSNSYAELGSIWASAVVCFPTLAAHLIGQLLKYKGEDQIVFGSDSIWFGSPQWQLEAFWRFKIPEEIRERWDYPELTEQAKRKIIGLNSARLYGLDSDPRKYTAMPASYESRMSSQLRALMELPPPPADRLAKIKATYREAGPERNTVQYGWVRVRP
jgi:predicted TIM-barrel fold metal-dependent hydrolase